jgi:hypothetical protein
VHETDARSFARKFARALKNLLKIRDGARKIAEIRAGTARITFASGNSRKFPALDRPSRLLHPKSSRAVDRYAYDRAGRTRAVTLLHDQGDVIRRDVPRSAV